MESTSSFGDRGDAVSMSLSFPNPSRLVSMGAMPIIFMADRCLLNGSDADLGKNKIVN